MEGIGNHKATAKSFAVTHLPMLTDRQYDRVVEALTKQLEHAYQLGVRDGKAETER
jgi:hypothetical protein